jgi:hypothetical protein
MQRLSKPSFSRWLAISASLPLWACLSHQAQAADIKDGLVAYWNFDAKNFKDTVGKFDGTENPDQLKPIVFTDGKTGFGQSIQLDGADQWVEITGGEPDDSSAQQR